MKWNLENVSFVIMKWLHYPINSIKVYSPSNPPDITLLHSHNNEKK
jgi:hypothetical protein